jgi:hypothetical protein
VRLRSCDQPRSQGGNRNRDARQDA